MARVRKSGSADGRTVRCSIVLGADDHRRLRALAVARDTTIQDCVLAALLPTLAGVRVPWTVGPDRPAEPEPNRAVG